jgi:hypothetical protein
MAEREGFLKNRGRMLLVAAPQCYGNYVNVAIEYD